MTSMAFAGHWCSALDSTTFSLLTSGQRRIWHQSSRAQEAISGYALCFLRHSTLPPASMHDANAGCLMVLHTAHRYLNVARRCDSRLCNPQRRMCNAHLEYAHRSFHRSGRVMMQRHRNRRSPLAAAQKSVLQQQPQPQMPLWPRRTSRLCIHTLLVYAICSCRRRSDAESLPLDPDK